MRYNIGIGRYIICIYGCWKVPTLTPLLLRYVWVIGFIDAMWLVGFSGLIIHDSQVFVTVSPSGTYWAQHMQNNCRIAISRGFGPL